MRKTLPLLLLPVFLFPAVAAAESWAVLGIRDPDDAPLGAKLEEVRKAVSAHLPAGDRLLSAKETAQRIGFPTATVQELEAALADAELLFFQLEYDAARSKLEEALEALARGRESPAELGRSLRLLLALIYLQEPGGREKAADVLRPMAALAALPDTIRRTTPEAVAQLWDEVRAAASARAEGWLVVDCTGCHGGEVWLEGLAVGTTQQSIGLAPGTYRLVLRGLAGSEGKRSLAREVRIRSGEETRLRIDLAIEAALLGDDGPSLSVEASLERAPYLAGLLGADRLLLWRFAAAEGSIEAWEADGAAVRGPWRRLQGESLDASVGALVAEIVEGRSPVLVSTPAERAEEPPPFLRQDPSGSWRPAARWATLGATVAMVGGAAWLTLDTFSANSELERLEKLGAYRSVQEARRAEQLADSIATRRTWNTVLWVGAAAGVVATVLLFMEGEAEAGRFVDGMESGR